MADLYRVGGLAKFPGQPFYHVDRSMLTTCAAERYREITAVDDVKVFYPEADKGFQLVGHLMNQSGALKKVNNGPVEAGKIPKGLFPIRIGQAAKIEHCVRVGGRTALEGERLKQQYRSRLRCALCKTADSYPEFIGRHDAGIDRSFGCIRKRCQ